MLTPKKRMQWEVGGHLVYCPYHWRGNTASPDLPLYLDRTKISKACCAQPLFHFKKRERIIIAAKKIKTSFESEVLMKGEKCLR